jgi:kynurenine formamidase
MAVETQPDLIDLSHPIEDGAITYPGLPGPQISDHLSYDESHGRYAEGTEFQIGRITMVSNTGTYLDAPSHRYRLGDDLAALPLERVAALPGMVVDATGLTAVGRDHLEAYVVGGHAVLVRTGWDQHWRTDAYGDPSAPHLTRDAAEWLVDQGATLVGIDAVNIDSMADGERPVHTVLLAAGIPVLEHLTALEQLPPRGFRLHAAPVPVRGMGTFPVRAYAVLDPSDASRS